MTDAPVSADPPAAPTIDSNLGPVWLVAIPSFVSTAVLVLQNVGAASEQIKIVAVNLHVEPYLPYVAAVMAVVLTVAPLIGGLRWCYTRAVSRGKRWALWLRDTMPWNKGQPL